MHLPHVEPFEKNPVFFFTASVQRRRPVLAGRAAFDVLVGIWGRSALRDGWYVGKFMIMPDHIHFFAVPAIAAKTRSEWHKMWKSVSARRLQREEGVSLPLWQTDTFDHILRNKKSYAEKWSYVQENPVRKGLVSVAAEWPWQGEIHDLTIR